MAEDPPQSLPGSDFYDDNFHAGVLPLSRDDIISKSSNAPIYSPPSEDIHAEAIWSSGPPTPHDALAFCDTEHEKSVDADLAHIRQSLDGEDGDTHSTELPHQSHTESASEEIQGNGDKPDGSSPSTTADSPIEATNGRQHPRQTQPTASAKRKQPAKRQHTKITIPLQPLTPQVPPPLALSSADDLEDTLEPAKKKRAATPRTKPKSNPEDEWDAPVRAQQAVRRQQGSPRASTRLRK